MKYHRVICRVEHVRDDVVQFAVPSWSIDQSVFVSINDIPTEFHKFLTPKSYLLAYARLNAENAKDVALKDFELAPEPTERGF